MQNFQMNNSINGEQYLNDFLLEGENFFADSDFQLERTYSDYVDYMEEGYAPFRPPNVMTMHAPCDPNIIKQVIGRKGSGFIRITKDSGVDSIWHDRKSNMIHINSDIGKNLSKAQKMVKNRVAFYYRKARREKQPVFRNRWDSHEPLKFQ